MMDVYEKLVKAKAEDKLPQITVSLRIDGPGSTLDMRAWQHIFYQHRDPDLEDAKSDWSKDIPRTVGISIDVGTDIVASPIEKGMLCVESWDYDYVRLARKDEITHNKENYLLLIMNIFGLDGIKFTIRNHDSKLKSAGMGGSAAVTTAVALFANKLTGSKYNNDQIIGMASMIEEDFGVSLTGTQEQSCVVYGGVKDYIWFPYGTPGKGNFFGSSIRQTLLEEEDYPELKKRLDVYFCLERFSADVNAIWREELKNVNGFKLQRKFMELAYEYREAIRNKDWKAVEAPVEEYRKIREELCEHYMSPSAHQINEVCKKHGAVCFPLGGGGGSVMVYSAEPEILLKVRQELDGKFKLIDYNISETGHVFKNMESF
jgi:D-glycero-alpha-D-manno-heptose-7-phosphate kinase